MCLGVPWRLYDHLEGRRREWHIWLSCVCQVYHKVSVRIMHALMTYGRRCRVNPPGPHSASTAYWPNDANAACTGRANGFRTLIGCPHKLHSVEFPNSNNQTAPKEYAKGWNMKNPYYTTLWVVLCEKFFITKGLLTYLLPPHLPFCVVQILGTTCRPQHPKIINIIATQIHQAVHDLDISCWPGLPICAHRQPLSACKGSCD